MVPRRARGADPGRMNRQADQHFSAASPTHGVAGHAGHPQAGRWDCASGLQGPRGPVPSVCSRLLIALALHPWAGLECVQKVEHGLPVHGRLVCRTRRWGKVLGGSFFKGARRYAPLPR